MTTSARGSPENSRVDGRPDGPPENLPLPEPEIKSAKGWGGADGSKGPGLGPASEAVKPRPSKAFVRSHPAHFIAFGAGAGLSPIAPGTAGTLAAFPLFWLFNYVLDPVKFFLLINVMFVAGIWACSVTGKTLGSHDHGGMVWDEITAFLLVLFLTPNNLIWQASGFLLFRLFDIIKPPPIGYYDKKLRGGFGVMFDDLLAAFLTLLCLAAWKAFAI